MVIDRLSRAGPFVHRATRQKPRLACKCSPRRHALLAQVLSSTERLGKLVQLLLTFEPSIVERAASLLTRLVEDNPTLPRLYLSGAFFFALMYTGSNVLPLIRFLHVAHLQQLYQDEESGSASGLAARSYLTLILPQAMVCCLEVHGPDKFAKDDEAMIASDDI